jgi:hypothetical protein
MENSTKERVREEAWDIMKSIFISVTVGVIVIVIGHITGSDSASE